MNLYETKKLERIERLKSRAEKQQAIADENSFSRITGETNTGIPLGQPILVGHHSEHRHRRHLERIDNKLRKGFEAEKNARKLLDAAHSAETRAAIDSDNPAAQNLLSEKISVMEATRARHVTINKLVRACKGDAPILSASLLLAFPDIKDPYFMASQLLTPDFAGRIGIPAYVLSNAGAEIRRLKKRMQEIAVIQSAGNFEPFVVHTGPVDGDIGVELVDGQIQVEFPWKPNDTTRDKLKRAPLALKWSSFSKRWVRKHTATTATKYFKVSLIEVLKEAKQ